VQLVHASGGEPSGELILVEAREVRGSELSELQPPEDRLYVYPDGYLVAVEGALAYGTL
jgi:hypothetical protein